MKYVLIAGCKNPSSDIFQMFFKHYPLLRNVVRPSVQTGQLKNEIDINLLLMDISPCAAGG